VLKRGSELISDQQYVYAELSYDKAIELDPTDWRGYWGKSMVLKDQGKWFKAFQAARRGCEACPSEQRLSDLSDSTRQAYMSAKKEAAELAALPKDADCPGAIVTDAPLPPMVPREFSGRIATREERECDKNMMLNVFREQWERISDSKKALMLKDAFKDSGAAKGYSNEQQAGLQIAGGHQPMDRPDDVDLPQDYGKQVGIMTAADMRKNHNCECHRKLISIHGDIFDVSDRPDKYGEGAPYYYFSGSDITWGLVSGVDTEETTNMFFDFWKVDELEERQKKLQIICSWTGFYEVEYGKRVGQLKEYQTDHKLPAPPLTNDDCCIQ